MSLSNLLVGLQIFNKYNGSLALGHDEIYAGQPEGKKLTQAEVNKLFDNGWFLDCSGCASNKAKNAFTEPPDEFPDDEPKARHKFTCNEWKIFV